MSRCPDPTQSPAGGSRPIGEVHTPPPPRGPKASETALRGGRRRRVRIGACGSAHATLDSATLQTRCFRFRFLPHPARGAGAVQGPGSRTPKPTLQPPRAGRRAPRQEQVGGRRRDPLPPRPDPAQPGGPGLGVAAGTRRSPGKPPQRGLGDPRAPYAATRRETAARSGAGPPSSRNLAFPFCGMGTIMLPL